MAITVTVTTRVGCPDLPWVVSVDDTAVTVVIDAPLQARVDLERVTPCSSMLAGDVTWAADQFATRLLNELTAKAGTFSGSIIDPDTAHAALMEAYMHAQDVDTILAGCTPA